MNTKGEGPDGPRSLLSLKGSQHADSAVAHHRTMDIAQASIQGFFHEDPLSRLKLFIFFHFGMALVCSMFEPDVSAFIAVLGYTAILHTQLEPLNLYLVLLPVSVVVDVFRLSIYSGKFATSTSGFLIFLDITKIVGKFLGIWFGYQVSKEWEAGGGSYQDFAGGVAPVSTGARVDPYTTGAGGFGDEAPKAAPAAPDSATINYQQGYQGGMG